MATKEFGSFSSEEFRSYTKEDLRVLSKMKLHEHMGRLSKREREHQAEVIASVCEVERRKLYFGFGAKNLFDYMTTHREFSVGSAQRYIDAARLCLAVPTLNEDIAKGDLNLSQVTIVAKTVRQKEKEEPKFKMEAPQAAALFERIKGEDGRSTQQIIAQEFEVEVKERDSARIQADGSVRHESTFSKEQEAMLQRVKELISHSHPNPSLNDVFEYLAKDWLKRHDPLIAEGRRKKTPEKQADGKVSGKNDDHYQVVVNQEPSPRQSTQSQEMGKCRNAQKDSQVTEESLQVRKNAHLTQDASSRTQDSGLQQQEEPWPHGPIPAKRTYISVHTVRFVHRRDRSCRWKNKETGEFCGSKFQVQPDHIIPLWGGRHE